MSLFDTLKRQAAQAARSATNQAGQNIVQGAKNTVSGMGNKTYKVTLQQLPVNLAQLQSMPEADLKSPEKAAALTIAALCVYPVDKEACFEMLNFLHGPKGLSTYDKQFIADRFRDKDYVPRSYFDGATPENNYEPSEPYTLTFFENPYSRDNFSEGYITLHIKSGGADSARQVKLLHALLHIRVVKRGVARAKVDAYTWRVPARGLALHGAVKVDIALAAVLAKFLRHTLGQQREQRLYVGVLALYL